MLETLRRNTVTAIAARNIAGAELSDALVVCKWAHEKGIGSILSPWALPRESPDDMLNRYSAAARAITSHRLNCHLAIKLGSIGDDIGLFRELVSAVRESNIRIHFDSLGPETASSKFGFLEKAVASYEHLGCTLPSRWKRSVEDAERAIELGLYVRIVKGQWSDPSAPRLDIRENYLAIVSRLAGRSRHVGVATHDYQLARKALDRLRSSGTDFEVEQFFSLPLNAEGLSQQIGCPYRIYIAYGSPGIPYNVKLSLSRPGLLAWILSDYVLKPGRPWEDISSRSCFTTAVEDRVSGADDRAGDSLGPLPGTPSQTSHSQRSDVRREAKK
jgi:proline dehydrogenase